VLEQLFTIRDTLSVPSYIHMSEDTKPHFHRFTAQCKTTQCTPRGSSKPGCCVGHKRLADHFSRLL